MLRRALLSVLILSAGNAFSQETSFDQYASTPKDPSLEFALDYKIARPRLEYPLWDRDFDVYYGHLTRNLRKTQSAISSNEHGVDVTMTPNSIIPHAQLDTTTILNDPGKLVGTWRMIKFRALLFNDSVDVATKTYYRLPDKLLEDKSRDEAFAVLTEKSFKLYVKEVGKSSFRKDMTAKYQVENRRFMMVYRMSKASAGVSQFGMDENGYLILNYPKVIERVKKGEFFSYYTVVEQYIFQKVN